MTSIKHTFPVQFFLYIDTICMIASCLVKKCSSHLYREGRCCSGVFHQSGIFFLEMKFFPYQRHSLKTLIDYLRHKSCSEFLADNSEENQIIKIVCGLLNHFLLTIPYSFQTESFSQ